jgi:(1->4)-alpha-D-glucan 1-alpha-D-glucosylmutase
LVDPDNRRPVDFAARERLLGGDAPLEELTRRWADGGIKHQLLARGLALRERCPDLFARGEYHPLRVEGPSSGHAVAFARVLGDQVAITLVGRHLGRLLDGATRPLVSPEAWKDTALVLPQPWRQHRFSDQLATGTTAPQDSRLRLAALLGDFPVALLSNV